MSNSKKVSTFIIVLLFSSLFLSCSRNESFAPEITISSESNSETKINETIQTIIPSSTPTNVMHKSTGE